LGYVLGREIAKTVDHYSRALSVVGMAGLG
jgi:hypothetical protein